MVRKNKPNEFTITRVYDASVEEVWDAWTDPEQVSQWWGPRGFTLTTHSKDLRVGGTWRYTMHGPDGTDWENVTLYHEVEPLKKLVYDHGASDDRPPLFRVTALFSESDGRTTLSMTMTLASAEAVAEIRKFIKQAGGDSTWDRLAEYLAQTVEGKSRFIIHRVFEAPADLVFSLWTDPQHLIQWLPPTGLTMEYFKSDIRAGHQTHWRMTDGRAMTFFGRHDYIEISPPRRIVYRQQFCDETGSGTLRHPGTPVWPATLMTTVFFEEEGPESTRVAVAWEPEGPTTPEELQAFLASRAGMTLGWTGSFDKLEEQLAARRE